MLRRYAVFNPHATFHYVDEGQHTDFPATEPSWQKWLPTDPTSPHWYTVERLRALLAAYLAEEAKPDSRPRTVREFVAEFQGLKGTAKQKAVTEAAGLSGALLRDLVAGQDLAEERVRALLEAMQRESREVKPVALGVLGEAHLTQCLVRDYGVEEDSVKYKRIADSTREGVPFVLEAAFGWHTERGRTREKVLGLNFAPSLGTPFRDLKLGEARVDSYDPVVVIVHLTSPRLDFTDRGKGTLTLAPVLQSTLDEAVKSVTKHWTALKRQADRQERVRERDIEHYLKAQRRHYLSVKEAAYRVMEQAYMAAGGADGLPANARQIMYAARPHVLELTGDKLWKNSAYFTQHLVPDFMAEYPGLTKYWDVVFDDRGHFTEPHTGRQLGVGTLAVRNYVRSWHDTVTDDDESFVISHEVETSGPRNRYKFVLFVEKEGFNPLLEKAQIAERFDLAIMSTKGMSVTAARQLVEDLTAAGVTILVLHDFDKAGFSIVHTLRSDTRRFKYRTPPQVVDLGLRLTDAQAMQLQSEPVEYDSEKDPRVNLHESGATVEECDFLVQRRTAGGWMGQRVELNAMTSRQLIDWLEAKLIAAGVEKVVPDKATLEKAYKRAVRQAAVQKAIDEALQNFDEDSAIDIPDDLAERVREAITGTATSWDMALWGMVREPEENEEEEAA